MDEALTHDFQVSANIVLQTQRLIKRDDMYSQAVYHMHLHAPKLL